MDAQAIYYALAVLLVVIGLLGIVLPALPGVPLMFAGMLLAAWAGDFQRIGTTTLAILGVLTALSLVADFWATAVGAKRVGASRMAIVGAVAGTFVGMFFGLPGILAGPFAGALVGELASRRRMGREDIGQATKIGFGTWLGIAFGIALKLMLAFAMIATFAWAWFT
ncbi:MAG: DUF456 domain-containing protein [Luteimonas sp.]|nr:DUF456 domain-containing protein [Luteimonas sp.]